MEPLHLHNLRQNFPQAFFVLVISPVKCLFSLRVFAQHLANLIKLQMFLPNTPMPFPLKYMKGMPRPIRQQLGVLAEYEAMVATTPPLGQSDGHTYCIGYIGS
jgi:hypothetical protein